MTNPATVETTAAKTEERRKEAAIFLEVEQEDERRKGSEAPEGEIVYMNGTSNGLNCRQLA
jgi:hypothetical protein